MVLDDKEKKVLEDLMGEVRPGQKYKIDTSRTRDVTQKSTGRAIEVVVNYNSGSSETLYLIRHNPKNFADMDEIRAAIATGIERGKRSLRKFVRSMDGGAAKERYQASLNDLLKGFETGGNADPFLEWTSSGPWNYVLEKKTEVGYKRGMADEMYELVKRMKTCVGTALEAAHIGAPYEDHHWTWAGVARNGGFNRLRKK